MFVKNHKKIFKKTFSFCNMCDIFVIVKARKRFSEWFRMVTPDNETEEKL